MKRALHAIVLSSLLLPQTQLIAEDDYYLDNPKSRKVLERIIDDATDRKYDYISQSINKKMAEDMTECVYQVVHEFRYEKITYTYGKDGKASEKKEPYAHTINGSCVLIKKSRKEKKLLFLTAKHLVNNPTPPEPNDATGRPLVRYKLVSSHPKVVLFKTEYPIQIVMWKELRAVASSPNADLSLLEGDVASEKELNSYKVSPPLGNSDELAFGHIIYTVGFSFAITKVLGEGRVSSPGDPGLVFDDTEFHTYSLTNFGNSGGAAYAIRDGHPELVGIASRKRKDAEGLNLYVRINHAKALLKDTHVPAYFREK